jgi:hypothetical protein
MVTIIPEDKRRMMSYEDIEKEYDGKWLFMVKVTDKPFEAMPVIIADKSWEDYNKGIYREFNDDVDSGATMHLSLLGDAPEMLGQY